MRGEWIALLTTLCWSIGIFPFTEAARRLGSAALNQYRLLLAWIIITLLLIIFYPITFTDLFVTPRYHHYLFLGLSGIIGFSIGDYFAFNAFKILGPKLASLYLTFAPAAALLAGFLVLGQTINMIGIAGIAVTLGGVIWLTLSKKDKQASQNAGFSRNAKGSLYGVLAALCQGSGLVFSKLGMNYYPEALPTLHAVWIRLLFAFTAAFMASVIAGRLVKNTITVVTNRNNGLPYLVAGALLGPVMGVSLSLLAIQYMEVAAAQTIFDLMPIMVLPINYFYYKEKITAAAIIASLVAVLGVAILIWRNTIWLWI